MESQSLERMSKANRQGFIGQCTKHSLTCRLADINMTRQEQNMSCTKLRSYNYTWTESIACKDTGRNTFGLGCQFSLSPLLIRWMSSCRSPVADRGCSNEFSLLNWSGTTSWRSSRIGPSQNSVRILSSDTLRWKGTGLTGLASLDGVSSLRGMFDMID